MPKYVNARVRTTVYQSEIEEAFWPGGSVYENMRRIAFYNVGVAQRHAPVRTGNLQRSIFYVLTPYGKTQTRYTIGTDVPYASYTLEGTTGPIFPNKSVFLWVRPAPYSRYTQRFPRMSVRGQKGNDWLGESVRETFYEQGL